MTVTIYEQHGSCALTDGESPQVERKYVIEGTSDPATARTEFLDILPNEYMGLFLNEIEIEPVGTDWWYGTATYSLDEMGDSSGDSWSYEFDTTGGSTKITQSLTTVSGYAPTGKTAPNFQGAIGYDGQTVNGCEITIPTFKWTETHYKPVIFIDKNYRLTLANMTGTVNQNAFRDFQAGEVLFLGAVGQRRGNKDWELQYHFAASPNLSNLSVGQISGIAKEGWQYLWVMYEEIEDAYKLISVPRAAYVEQVYRYTDFLWLLIGTLPA